MDILRENADNEKLIEDYLFSGYQPASYRLSSNTDQQFARPIEDEDIFGIETGVKQTKTNLDSETYLPDLVITDKLNDGTQFDSLSSHDYGLNYDEQNRLDEALDQEDNCLLSKFSPTKTKSYADIDLDDIFDDEEDSKSTNQSIAKQIEKNYEAFNKRQSNVTAKKIGTSPARLKAQQTRQKLKEQILAKGIMPSNISLDCDKDGMIEVNVTGRPLITPSKGRIIYEKLLQKSIEKKKGPYGGRKVTWPIYSEVLRKKICSDKRKVWDSFQTPTDNFDDEEELLESEDEPENSQPSSPKDILLNSNEQSLDGSGSVSPSLSVPEADGDSRVTPSPQQSCEAENEDSDY